MKKVLFLALFVSLSTTIMAMQWVGCVYTSLSVSNDGSWSADVLLVHGFPDSLVLVSGSDTARFIFSSSDTIGMSYEDCTISINGNGDESILSFSWSKNTYSSKAIAMNPALDSLEIMPIIKYWDVDIYHVYFRGDILRYGGANEFPALGDGRIIHVNNANIIISDDCARLGCSYYLETAGGVLYPYVLKGRVYDQNGNALPTSCFSLLNGGRCNNSLIMTDLDGAYLLDVEYMVQQLELVYYINNRFLSIPIQPITLGKPFGDTINVDIHLLGPLAEGETAPEAITVQRSGSILHVSGAVREIVLIDASGHSLSCTRSANVDIEQLPAGIYFLSVTLEDGRVVRHPFNK